MAGNSDACRRQRTDQHQVEPKCGETSPEPSRLLDLPGGHPARAICFDVYETNVGLSRRKFGIHIRISRAKAAAKPIPGLPFGWPSSLYSLAISFIGVCASMLRILGGQST
jgi:hypothetical protein